MKQFESGDMLGSDSSGCYDIWGQLGHRISPDSIPLSEQGTGKLPNCGGKSRRELQFVPLSPNKPIMVKNFPIYARQKGKAFEGIR